MLESGTRLGPYKILGSIGAGGMGEVYRARDIRLDRDVAVKVLSDRLIGDPDALIRFEREAKAVAALSHPNILAIHDFHSDQGIYFTVTEFLEGGTLRSRISEGPIPWRKAGEIAIAVADGLAAAHSKGIVHRDLKPENIFVTSHGQVKILDFGLAEILEAKGLTDSISPTASADTEEKVVGTIAYMAPEQIRGGSADARSDIFSFGVVLYEMVTGKRPFSRDTAYETVAAILKEDPADLDQSGRRIPFELQTLIRHCLEKNPNERSQSAHDVAFELRNILNPSRSSEAVPLFFQARTNWPFWSAILLLLILIGGSAGYFVYQRRQIRSIAILPFENATSDSETEYLSDGITESLIDNLAQLPNLRVMARSTVFRYKGQNPDPKKIGLDLRVDAILTGNMRKENDSLLIAAELVKVSDGSHLWGESYIQKMNQILPIQQQISSEIVQSLRLKLTGEQQKRLTKRYTENPEAYQLYLKGRYSWNKRTPEGLKKSVEYFQQAIDRDPGYARAYAGLADAYSVLGNYDVIPMHDALQRAKGAAIRALQIDEQLGEAHASLGLIQFYYWQWQESEKEFKRAIELSPNYSTAHHWYANVLAAIGRQSEAVSEITKAQDLDPLSLIINETLALHLMFARRYDEAIEQSKRTLELDPNFVFAHQTLGEIYVQKQMYDKAIQEFQTALYLTGGSQEYAAELAHVYAVSGQPEKAREILDQLNRDSAKATISPFNLALVYAGLGEKDEAFQYLEKTRQTHSQSIAFVKLDPRLAPLRTDPRYAKLLNSIGLSP